LISPSSLDQAQRPVTFVSLEIESLSRSAVDGGWLAHA
jgi:hypothetical protein